MTLVVGEDEHIGTKSEEDAGRTGATRVQYMTYGGMYSQSCFCEIHFGGVPSSNTGVQTQAYTELRTTSTFEYFKIYYEGMMYDAYYYYYYYY